MYCCYKEKKRKFSVIWTYLKRFKTWKFIGDVIELNTAYKRVSILPPSLRSTTGTWDYGDTQCKMGGDNATLLSMCPLRLYTILTIYFHKGANISVKIIILW